MLKAILVGAVCLLGTALAGNAQAQYQPYPYGQVAQQPQYQPPYNQVTAIPPSWNYDPYTSGLSPCPQRDPRDTDSCRQQMPPTLGQPDYRPH